MDYFTVDYGLTGPNDPTSENGQLFLTEYLVLATIYPKLLDRWYAQYTFSLQLKRNEVAPGLYTRNRDLASSRVTSHDNLIGIMVGSKLIGTEHRFRVWKYLLTHFGTYDSSQGGSTQLSRLLPFNPGNYFIFGMCAESNLAYLFLPFYILNLLIECLKPKANTSGKILDFISLYVLKSTKIGSVLFKFYEFMMKRQYGENYIKELMTIYHGSQGVDFPINKVFNV